MIQNTPEKPFLEIQNLGKTYRFSKNPALENINLEINEGDKIGLIGSNGSGKTTLLRLIMNYIKPDQGEIIIKGQTNLENVHHFIGFVGESQEGLENFTPRELFSMAAKMHDMNKQQATNRANELLEFSGLQDVADNLIGSFSKGMAQRTFISSAIVHNPEILLLDEPMSGLDPQARIDVKNFLGKLANYTLIYASHNFEEIEEYTSTVIFLHQGKIVQQLSLNDTNKEIFLLEIDRNIKDFLNEFQHLDPKILDDKSENSKLQFRADTKDFQKFIEYCKTKNVKIVKIRSRSILEDAYQKYVKNYP
jgi:ABC-2 type transport system ATP-binding protein